MNLKCLHSRCMIINTSVSSFDFQDSLSSAQIIDIALLSYKKCHHFNSVFFYIQFKYNWYYPNIDHV